MKVYAFIAGLYLLGFWQAALIQHLPWWASLLSSVPVGLCLGFAWDFAERKVKA